jgi:dCMP deaminase
VRRVSRPSWDDIWSQVADQVAQRSLCVRAQVGAVIVNADNRIVSTGYNGPPAGFEHRHLPCSEWCERGADPDGGDMYRCASVHAEANALLTGDRSSWQGGAMYVTKHPCWECAKLIANSGLAALLVYPVEPTPPAHHSYNTYKWLQEECGLHVAVSLEA